MLLLAVLRRVGTVLPVETLFVLGACGRCWDCQFWLRGCEVEMGVVGGVIGDGGGIGPLGFPTIAVDLYLLEGSRLSMTGSLEGSLQLVDQPYST